MHKQEHLTPLIKIMIVPITHTCFYFIFINTITYAQNCTLSRLNALLRAPNIIMQCTRREDLYVAQL